MLRHKQATIAFAAFLTFGALGATASLAADTGESAAQSDDGQKVEKVPGVNPDKSLTQQLDENKGVITPPPTGDSEIQTTVPDPNPGTTPVIPPPGTPGGNQNVVPK